MKMICPKLDQPRWVCFRPVFVLFALIALAHVAAAQTPTDPNLAPPVFGVISGMVVDDSGRPFPGAAVYLAPAGQIPPNKYVSRGELTQNDGSFRFTSVRPGTYELAPDFPGYFPSDVDAPKGTMATSPLGAKVQLKLIKGGVITDKVVDEHGDPLGNVSVRATRIMDVPGRKTPLGSYGANANTDERGLFRIYGLPDGKYKLTVHWTLLPNDSAQLNYQEIVVIVKIGREVVAPIMRELPSSNQAGAALRQR
jgi:hypothetical protein